MFLFKYVPSTKIGFLPVSVFLACSELFESVLLDLLLRYLKVNITGPFPGQKIEHAG